MIFVTIGSALPFDRLIAAMDAWAEAHPDQPIRAQIGDGDYTPRHMPWDRSLSRPDYAAAIETAEVIVAHAGMGSILTAGEYATPIVLLARRAALGEHRNDHQLDTARWFADRPGIFVAADAAALPDAIEQARTARTAGNSMARTADPQFLDRLRAFVMT